jgi:hypothetical protein
MLSITKTCILHSSLDKSQENLQSLPDNVHMTPTQTSCLEVFHTYLPFVCLVRTVLQCHEYLYVLSSSVMKPITKGRLTMRWWASWILPNWQYSHVSVTSIPLNNMRVLESMRYYREYFATVRAILASSQCWCRSD